jgi:nitrate reductase gamma subunit
MNGDAFWFAALPNAALIAAAAAVLYRLAVRPLPATPAAPARGAAGVWGRIPFQWGLTLVLAGHLLALVLPGTILAWNGAPIRLYLLEASGLALALWAIAGFAVMIGTFFRTGLRRPPAADAAVVVLLGFLLVSGVLIALFYRWGSSWGSSILAPYLWSVVTGGADPDVVGDLPWLVQAHLVSTFALLVAFPLSRWWGLVVAVWDRAAAAVADARTGARPAGAAAGAMSWGAAYGRAAVILVTVTVLTVWLPSRVIQALSTSDRVVQDIAGTGVWVVMLAVVLAGLRWAQRSGRI